MRSGTAGSDLRGVDSALITPEHGRADTAMLPFDTALRFVVATIAAGTILGVVLRRKSSVCRLFLLYLASAAVGPLLIVGWPGTFWNWTYLAAADAVQVVLRVGVVFEIARKSFRAYPRGHTVADAGIAIVLLGILLFVASTPRHFGDAFELARVLERVSYGAGVLFLMYLGTAWYYGIPLDPFHRAIATGFGVVTVLVGCASLLWRFDPAFGLGRDFIVKTAYACVLAFWLVSAWRRDDFSDLAPETLRRIYPWRVR